MNHTLTKADTSRTTRLPKDFISKVWKSLFYKKSSKGNSGIGIKTPRYKKEESSIPEFGLYFLTLGLFLTAHVPDPSLLSCGKGCRGQG